MVIEREEMIKILSHVFISKGKSFEERTDEEIIYLFGQLLRPIKRTDFILKELKCLESKLEK